MPRLVVLTVLSFASLSMMRGVIAAAATDDQCQAEDRCHVGEPSPPMVSLMQKQMSLSKIVNSDLSTKGPVKTVTDGLSTYAYFKGDRCGYGYDGGGGYGPFRNIPSDSECNTAAQKLGLSDTESKNYDYVYDRWNPWPNKGGSHSYPQGCSYDDVQERRSQEPLKYKNNYKNKDKYTKPNDRLDMICVKEFKKAKKVGDGTCDAEFGLKSKSGRGKTPTPSLSDCEAFCSATTGCKFFSYYSNKGGCKTYKRCDKLRSQRNPCVTYKMP